MCGCEFKSWNLRFLLFVGLIPQLLCATNQSLKISGSDLFASWLPRYFETEQPSEPVTFSLLGSEIGKASLESHNADVCLYLSADQEPPPLPVGYQSIPIAYYVLYVWADDSFPSRSISKEIINRIGNASTFTPIAHWKGVFEESDRTWDAKQAEILIDHSQDDFTLGFFRLAFLQSGTPSVRVQVCPHKAYLERLMDLNRGCIIISPRSQFYLRKTKKLQLADFGDAASFPASEENITFGDYSASFPIFLIGSPENPHFQTALDHLQSESMRAAMRENFLLPAIH